jgi:hypothetical protein
MEPHSNKRTGRKKFGSWIPFQSSERRDAVRFDVLQENPCFIKHRDRSKESKGSGREYIIINVCTRQVVDGLESSSPEGEADE